MGLKRRNPARDRLFTPPQMLAAMATFTPVVVRTPPPISGDERRRMIADAAYRRAERAGFAGDPLADWLTAEREIDGMLHARKAS
jgi:hypothetical protein